LIGSEGFNIGLELVLTKPGKLSSGLVLTGIGYFKTIKVRSKRTVE